MSAYILAVRPEPGLSATMAAGEALGLNMIGYPLFEVQPRAWECPEPAQIDALLVGSANAIRHGGDTLDRFKDRPVYAVGKTTADVARKAGFSVAATGAGGLQNVLDAIAPPMRLLRVAGAKHVPLDVPEGISMATVVAYESVAMELPEPLRPLESLGLTVLLHSAAAAEQFAHEVRRLALSRGRITLAVLGPRIADAAGSGWKAIHVSPVPDDRALLEMVRDLCI